MTKKLQRYRKKDDQLITAVQLDIETDGFTYKKWGAEQFCKQGDWIVNNNNDIYTVEKDSFARTYREQSTGRYVKLTPVWVEVADKPGFINTKEGKSEYKKGDYLVYNNEDRTDGYSVSAETFKRMYEADTSDKKSLELSLLPARQGDAIWIRWGATNAPHQMLIDMGTEQIGKRIRRDLMALPEDQRIIDLLVVTHVDRDHIGGILTCLVEAEPIPGLEIKDIWFNGFEHLKGGKIAQPDNSLPGMEPKGPAQGEKFTQWLRKQHWNKRFNGGPVQHIPSEEPVKVHFHDGLTLTVLGPTPERLEDFVDTWKKEVKKALEKGSLTDVSPGLEIMGEKEPPNLFEKQDLKKLADTKNPADHSEANGSSIALLLEYKGRKIILSGDAYSEDLVAGINAISINEPLKLDAFKLPHHGSKNNIFKPLVESVDCKRWLFSTDGTQFRHPDAEALARVITYSKVRTPMVSFNVPSKYNRWWDNEDWKEMYDYETEYGNHTNGLMLSFDIKNS